GTDTLVRRRPLPPDAQEQHGADAFQSGFSHGGSGRPRGGRGGAERRQPLDGVGAAGLPADTRTRRRITNHRVTEITESRNTERRQKSKAQSSRRRLFLALSY